MYCLRPFLGPYPYLNLSIPEEFRSNLKPVDTLDKRTDGEILDFLTKHVPVTSEKNCWTYWHAGLLSMLAWCQRNIISWVRLLGPCWTVRVLDSVPDSPNNALTWIELELLPESFVNGTMDGPYTGSHSADFLRSAALYSYGGVWMDVGCVLIQHLDKICWDNLEDPESSFTISVPWMCGQVMANHFVAARKVDPFIKRWHYLFIHFWHGRNNHSGIIESPLTTFVKDVKFEESIARGFKWDFKVDQITLVDNVGQVVAWLRLCMLKEPNGGFNGVEYWANKVLLFDSLTENWGAEHIVGFEGQKLFDVLATKRDGDEEIEGWKIAYKATWRLLTKSSMQKITHAKGFTASPTLGMLLDMKEDEGKDIEHGTFAELLRHGSVYFEQTRDEIDYVKAKRPPPEVIIRKGLYEV
ncbi:hypothetical protein K469DRAFT_735296 [Zopfia rhizophila CBS 207.26]|uniref:Capsule polysaccharide biosynthesis protein n=1 Tax=Zopfia rhizophila CBS 207.26 TaxID=1314779 RepID=A0A6A6ELY7_9PEZI|nr:hypothetical protein K469DRAFT_735296 [Zopfia rhizophila CBS 207.26]